MGNGKHNVKLKIASLTVRGDTNSGNYSFGIQLQKRSRGCLILSSSRNSHFGRNYDHFWACATLENRLSRDHPQIPHSNLQQEVLWFVSDQAIQFLSKFIAFV